MNQFLEKMMEQYNSTSWLKNWRTNSKVLRNWHLKLGQLSWQKEEDQREGFNTAWTRTLPNISCISQQFRDIREVISLILHCKTMCCYRMTSPSTSTTSGTRMNCTPLLKVNWSQEEEASRRIGNQCSSRQWTRWTTIKVWKTSNMIWTNPESQCTKILGQLTQIQYIGAIWSSLREKDCSFIKLDHMQSFFSTHNLRFVLRKWYQWRLERINTAKYINPQGYRASYLRQPRNMDVRILLIPKRENPPTITGNKACSTGKFVAHFSRAHVASIPKKASDVCTGKPVAVTLTFEFQVHLTVPSRKKIRIVR